jgi:MinD-like ATPase involved in chromosome partitioning or flagellar assembly
VTESVNNGEPFVLTDPSAPVSQNIFALARMVDGQVEQTVSATPDAKQAAPQPFWKRFRFGLSKAS